MKPVFGALSTAVLALTLTIGTSQKTFAQAQAQAQEQQDQDQDTEINTEDLKTIFGPLFEETSKSILKDIEDTKLNIKKASNAQAQSQIRDLILRVTGRMSTYTFSAFNLYLVQVEIKDDQKEFVVTKKQPLALPYILFGLKKVGPTETPWFEFIKDPKIAPESDPNKLIDLVELNFMTLTKEAAASSQTWLTVINSTKSSTPIQPAPHFKPNPNNDPSRNLTKYLLKAQQSRSREILL